MRAKLKEFWEKHMFMEELDFYATDPRFKYNPELNDKHETFSFKRKVEIMDEKAKRKKS